MFTNVPAAYAAARLLAEKSPTIRIGKMSLCALPNFH